MTPLEKATFKSQCLATTMTSAATHTLIQSTLTKADQFFHVHDLTHRTPDDFIPGYDPKRGSTLLILFPSIFLPYEELLDHPDLKVTAYSLEREVTISTGYVRAFINLIASVPSDVCDLLRATGNLTTISHSFGTITCTHN